MTDDAGNIIDATEQAIEAATHLTKKDAGAVEAMRLLARKIAAWDQIVEWAIEDAARNESRPVVPANDNVSIPTYLKYAEALGLTPAGRIKLVTDQKPATPTPTSKLASVSNIPRPTA